MGLLQKENKLPSIMIVENVLEILQVITGILREENYEVRPVLSGVQALQAAHNNPPDLILLDILMPGMDGYEVCRQLKADPETCEIPIIFLTGLDQQEDEEMGLSLGAVDYIIKPPKSAILKARVWAQIQLKLQRDQLCRQTQALLNTCSELEAFSYTVSHDLKSPIQVIKTYMGYIVDSLKAHEDAQGVEDAQEVLIATGHMQQLISDLMMLSKVSHDSVLVENVNLSRIAEYIIEEFKRLEPDREITFICQPDIQVATDSNLMQIAMKNLIQNAWKYTSKIKMSLIEFGMEVINEEQVYYLKDNGIGIDLLKSEGLFTAFKRMDNALAFEGTGIGLAIVSRIINRLGGRIWVESDCGSGSTFRFTLNQR